LPPPGDASLGFSKETWFLPVAPLCSAVLRRCGASVATACVCRAGGRVLLQELASFHVAATSSARSEERSFRVAALLRDGEPGVSILEAVHFD
jgi:hypothetical protein